MKKVENHFYRTIKYLFKTNYYNAERPGQIGNSAEMTSRLALGNIIWGRNSKCRTIIKSILSPD